MELNKIGVVLEQVKEEAYEGAINKLEHDIRDKIEKWIKKELQELFSAKIDTIIIFLESL